MHNPIGTWQAKQTIHFSEFSVGIGDEFTVIDKLEEDLVVVRTVNIECGATLSLIERSAIKR